MKTIRMTITLVLFFTFIVSEISAQVKDLDILKTELDTISSRKLKINSVSTDNSGNWIILYGDFGYSFIQAPLSVSTKITELNKSGKNMKSIRFSGDSWILLYQENAFMSNLEDNEIKSGLHGINRAKKKLVDFEFVNSSSYIVLFGTNSFFQTGLNSDLINKLNSIKKKNLAIKDIAFSRPDSWVVLYGKNGFAYTKIPEELSKKLNELYENKNDINHVFFIDNQWIVIYNDYKYFTSF